MLLIEIDFNNLVQFLVTLTFSHLKIFSYEYIENDLNKIFPGAIIIEQYFL